MRLLEQARPVFESAAAQQESQRRYLAQTYEYLGLAYRWQGILFERTQAYADALASYQESLDAFGQCISQAENTLDLIIQTDIVEKTCQPNYQQTQEIYDSLNGGQ